jgi:hypothetical protein
MKIVVLLFAITVSAAAQQSPAAVAQAVRGAAHLKNDMRDPDSLVVEKVMTRTDKKGYEVTCIQYRAKNGMGGMNRNAVHYTEQKGKEYIDFNGEAGYGWCAWTKYKPFVDITTEFTAAAALR